ncbi:caspase domain-containing protein, partial [Thermodesulfobacteriota bacterium]
MPNSNKIKIVLSVFLLLVAILAGVGLTALSKKNSVSMRYNHAFIIGINNYEHWPKLESPVKDAEAVAKILLDKYDFKKENIVLLTDKTAKQPTEATILDYLDGYIEKLTKNDNLLIFFSGHSTEDDDGETYWIPKDGRKRLRYWLSHTELSESYFSAKDFKAKSLLVLADSHVNSNLIKSTPISLSPYDLRYPEKIKEKASRKSREIIAFGDQHWPGSPETKGRGLFAHYLVKALEDNFLGIIDFENLMFDENIIFPISKIAGTKLQRGRLVTPT